MSSFTLKRQQLFEVLSSRLVFNAINVFRGWVCNYSILLDMPLAYVLYKFIEYITNGIID